MSRSDLHALVRDLRQYLEWQNIPLTGALPASSEEHAAFDAAQQARAEAKLRAALDAPPQPTPAPRPPAPQPTSDSTPASGKMPTLTQAPPRASAKAPAPKQSTRALWKDAEFGSRPQKTFQETSDGGAAATSADSPHDLKSVREELGDCDRCGLCKSRTKIVFGVGSPTARVMFVSAAPGGEEDLAGEPFVGKSGDLLNKMIAAMGFARADVYLTEINKCRPADGREPTAEQVATCQRFLDMQIEAIDPEVIVSLGAAAGRTLSGADPSAGPIRGTWQTYRDRPLMPTYHPADLLRNAAYKRDAWGDLQKVMARLGMKPAR